MSFQGVFRCEPEIRVQAPGRVNLIGEHTDYNGGFVLPIPIAEFTTVDLRIRNDRNVRLASSLASERNRVFEYKLGEESPCLNWIDYAQGITQCLRQRNFSISGFDAFVGSTIPVGSGLSSSAALEIALLGALNKAFHLVMDELQMSRIGQYAENEFVGAKVGIMDQFTISTAKPGQAIFLDCDTLKFQYLPVPADLMLIVIDSGVKRSIRHSQYNIRREECQNSASLLGVSNFREVTDMGHLEALPPVLRKRVRHVITENARVLHAVECLKACDFKAFGKLLYESHESLRDDFEVSIPEMDFLIRIASGFSKTYGARMTGGGFGGCAIIAAQSGGGANLGNEIVKAYNGGGQRGKFLTIVGGTKYESNCD